MAAPDYDSYKKMKVLGEGAFGKAILVEDIRDGMKWVMKQIDLSAMPQKEKEETIKEAKILQYLDHPNIVKFKDIHTTKKGKLCIIMEYADGGDLALKVKNQQGKLFQESQILDWFTQICLALKHVHDRKILHRDLKGQNIFLTRDNRVKLGDFGIARVLGNTLDKVKTQVGTPYYLSPEIIESKPYSYASDIWSLGAILYELCTLKPPFLADSLHFLALKIIKGQFNPISNQYSRDMNNLVKSLLQTQPNRRPSINQILKMPIIITRIKEFLTESVQKVEFAHTILHKQRLNCEIKLSEIKVIDEDKLRPPPNLLTKQSSSQAALQAPPQIKAQQPPPPVQQQVYVPPQMIAPKQPINQPQQQAQGNYRQQVQQPKNIQPQNNNKNGQYAQQRVEKPLVQQHVIQQPKQYVQQPKREIAREVVKPNTAQMQKQRNNSRNRVVDTEKQEQERKRMQQIKYEADLKRKEEEKKKLLKLQQEEEEKKKFKEEQKKKREQQQKEMREDLQKKRQQLQYHGSQPTLGDPEPIYIVRHNLSQPQQLEEQLEEYNSEEETQENLSGKKPQQQSNNNLSEDQQLSENTDDDRNMDYGLKQEQNEAEIEALQQAILCKEYEKVLEEVQEANNKVNQIDDAQFEKNRQKILEQFEIDEVIDVDDLEDDDEFNLTKTNNLTNQDVGLDYFQNPEALRGYLEQVLGKDKFSKAYKVSQNELFQYSIEDIEQRIKQNKVAIPFFSQDEAKQFIPLLFQLVVMDNSPK